MIKRLFVKEMPEGWQGCPSVIFSYKYHSLFSKSHIESEVRGYMEILQ